VAEAEVRPKFDGPAVAGQEDTGIGRRALISILLRRRRSESE
jgi:hypothetical protein